MIDIDELRALLAKTTPGPWKVVIDDSGDRDLTVPAIFAPDELDCAIVGWDGFCQRHWQSARGEREWNANAEFIVAAANALPALLDELEALRAANQWLPIGDALAKMAFVMSEPHLSGHRVVIGFEKSQDAWDCHREIVKFIPRPPQD